MHYSEISNKQRWYSYNPHLTDFLIWAARGRHFTLPVLSQAARSLHTVRQNNFKGKIKASVLLRRIKIDLPATTWRICERKGKNNESDLLNHSPGSSQITWSSVKKTELPGFKPVCTPFTNSSQSRRHRSRCVKARRNERWGRDRGDSARCCRFFFFLTCRPCSPLLALPSIRPQELNTSEAMSGERASLELTQSWQLLQQVTWQPAPVKLFC